METPFDRKQYNKQYYLNNKAVWLDKIQCPVCGLVFEKARKSQHSRSSKHLIAEKDILIRNLQNELSLFKQQLA